MIFNNNTNDFNIVASFSNNPRFDFGLYARGYHNAAKNLTRIFLMQDSYNDYDGYPIIFLYRHAFELHLKNIIYWGIRLINFRDLTIDSKLHNNHKLIELSITTCTILTNLFPNDLEISELSKTIKKYAEEFSTIDADSFSYRYPIDKMGNYSTTKHQVVNIQSLSEKMNSLLDSCEIINFGLDIETSNRIEIINALSYFCEN